MQRPNNAWKTPRNTIFFLHSAVLAGLAIGSTQWPLNARADYYLHPWSGHHLPKQTLDLTATLGVYNSTQNFDSSGLQQIPAEFLKYSRFGTDLNVGYGFSDRLTVFGNLSWARVQVETLGATGSSYGLNDQSLGASYRLLNGRMSGPSGSVLLGTTLDFQIRADLPAYSNNSLENANSPWLGDGSTDVTTGAVLNSPILRGRSHLVQLEAGAGYTLRSGGFSAAIPWSVRLTLDPQDKGLSAALGFAGIYSRQTDSSPPTAPAIRSPGTGGSAMTNAVNPTLMMFQGQLGYSLTRDLEIIGGGSHALSGNNAPSGTQIYGGVRLRTGAGARSKNPANLTPNEYGKSNRGFLTYNNGIEAKVLRTNDRLNLIKINKGSADGVEVGDIYDIFAVSTTGESGEAVARSKVTAVKSDEAVLNILEYFREIWIDEGFVARRPIE